MRSLADLVARPAFDEHMLAGRRVLRAGRRRPDRQPDKSDREIQARFMANLLG